VLDSLSSRYPQFAHILLDYNNFVSDPSWKSDRQNIF